MNIPKDLRYTETHEWIRADADTAIVGVTDHAQEELTDVVFVELPKVGTKVAAGAECAVVESVKAASDIYAPVSGEIIEINQRLETEPGIVNSDPYGEGWFFKIRMLAPEELRRLKTNESYAQQISKA
jgi:glycine cleavage system H protein